MKEIDWNKKNNVLKGMALSFSAGLLITLSAVSIVTRCGNLSFNFSGYLMAHQLNATLIFFDLLPFIFTLAFYFIIQQVIKKTKKINDQVLVEKKHTEEISLFVDKLSKGEFNLECTSSN